MQTGSAQDRRPQGRHATSARPRTHERSALAVCAAAPRAVDRGVLGAEQPDQGVALRAARCSGPVSAPTKCRPRGSPPRGRPARACSPPPPRRPNGPRPRGRGPPLRAARSRRPASPRPARVAARSANRSGGQRLKAPKALVPGVQHDVGHPVADARLREQVPRARPPPRGDGGGRDPTTRPRVRASGPRARDSAGRGAGRVPGRSNPEGGEEVVALARQAALESESLPCSAQPGDHAGLEVALEIERRVVAGARAARGRSRPRVGSTRTGCRRSVCELAPREHDDTIQLLAAGRRSAARSSTTQSIRASGMRSDAGRSAPAGRGSRRRRRTAARRGRGGGASASALENLDRERSRLPGRA